VYFTPSPETVTVRKGLDPQRLARQEDIACGEMWLLEGHLKNNCIGCMHRTCLGGIERG